MKSQVHINLFSCCLSRICFKILFLLLFTFLVKCWRWDSRPDSVETQAKRRENTINPWKEKCRPIVESKTNESESPRERNSHQTNVDYIVESFKQTTHECLSLFGRCWPEDIPFDRPRTWKDPHNYHNARIFLSSSVSTKQICFMSSDDIKGSLNNKGEFLCFTSFSFTAIQAINPE